MSAHVYAMIAGFACALASALMAILGVILTHDELFEWAQACFISGIALAVLSLALFITGR